MKKILFRPGKQKRLSFLWESEQVRERKKKKEPAKFLDTLLVFPPSPLLLCVYVEFLILLFFVCVYAQTQIKKKTEMHFQSLHEFLSISS